MELIFFNCSFFFDLDFKQITISDISNPQTYIFGPEAKYMIHINTCQIHAEISLQFQFMSKKNNGAYISIQISSEQYSLLINK